MSFQISKLVELNSNISTVYSENAPRTPLSMNALTSKANLGLKKFTRKKDTSIDAIKKCLQQKNVPKKTNNKKEDKQYLNKTLDAIQESQISKIIKSNSFIKFFKTPGLNPNIGAFQLDKISSRVSQQIRCQKKKQRNSFSLNNFQMKKTQQKKKALTIQQFDEFPTPRNCRKEIPKKKNSRILNYENSYTQRQNNEKQLPSQSKQIKVLQNEIIILEDENTRLRNQISVLVHEKQEEKAKKNKLQRYIKDQQNQLNNKKRAEIDFLEYIISNVHQIYLQIIKILQDNRQHKNTFISSRRSNEEDIFSSAKKNSQMTLGNFSKLFMEPARQFINEKIKDYSQLFQHSKVELNKLQIRQNVMLRSSFELQNSKVQNRMLNERLSAEKSRSLKFKQMYEKLKNTQEQSKTINKKQKIFSQGYLQSHPKISKGNQQSSLILSDLSDEQQPKQNNKRMIKQM